MHYFYVNRAFNFLFNHYKEEHYIEGLSQSLKNLEQEKIEKLAKENLERLNRLCEVNINE